MALLRSHVETHQLACLGKVVVYADAAGVVEVPQLQGLASIGGEVEDDLIAFCC